MYAYYEMPEECQMMDSVFRTTDLNLQGLADVIGKTFEETYMILHGERGHGTEKEIVVPSDADVALMCSALGIKSEKLRTCGRDSAADLLDEHVDLSTPAVFTEKRLIAEAKAEARADLMEFVLGAFSTEEILAEYRRRTPPIDRSKW